MECTIKNENSLLGSIFTSKTDFLHMETLTDKLLVYFGSFRGIDSKQRISCRSVYILNQTYYQHKEEIHSHLDGPCSIQVLREVYTNNNRSIEISILEDASRAVSEQGGTHQQ